LRNNPSTDSIELQEFLSLSKSRRREDYYRMAQLSANVSKAKIENEWNEKDTAELNALIAQYESLRQESLDAINNRTNIMLLGITAISALIAGSLTISNPQTNKNIIYAIFSGAIPLIIIFILLLWAGEAMRSHRVGYFLVADMEASINQKLERFVLSWEATLWAKVSDRDAIGGPSMMAILVLVLLAIGSPLFGMGMIDFKNIEQNLKVFLVIVPYSFLGLTAIYLYMKKDQLLNNPVIESKLNVPQQSSYERRRR
jgi:hypothetical protein